MSKFFLTENYQIIDLENMNSFWIEIVRFDGQSESESVYVIAKEDEMEWRIAEFSKEEEAEEYIEFIYEELTGES